MISSSISSGSLILRLRRGVVMISRTVLRGLSEEYGFWKMIWATRWYFTSWGFSPGLSTVSTLPPVTAVPRYKIWPSVGSSRVVKIRPRVVLPQPLSPTKPTVSPCHIPRLTPSTARTTLVFAPMRARARILGVI